MKIVIQLYDACGCACGAFSYDVETIDELLEAIDEVAYVGDMYEIKKVEENET